LEFKRLRRRSYSADIELALDAVTGSSVGSLLSVFKLVLILQKVKGKGIMPNCVELLFLFYLSLL